MMLKITSHWFWVMAVITLLNAAPVSLLASDGISRFVGTWTADAPESDMHAFYVLVAPSKSSVAAVTLMAGERMEGVGPAYYRVLGSNVKLQKGELVFDAEFAKYYEKPFTPNAAKPTAGTVSVATGRLDLNFQLRPVGDTLELVCKPKPGGECPAKELLFKKLVDKSNPKAGR